MTRRAHEKMVEFMRHWIETTGTSVHSMGWFGMVITAELVPCCLASLSEDYFKKSWL
jgi:hypothetical protein